MNNINRADSSLSSRFFQFLAVLLLLISFILIGQSIAALYFKYVLDVNIIDVYELADGSAEQKEKNQRLLLLMQTIAPFLSFILFPLIYIFFIKKYLKSIFTVNTYKAGSFLILGVFLFFTFLPVLQSLISWNQSWNLPDSLSHLEKGMIELEEKAKKITLMIIDYDSRKEFLIVLFVIAVIPGIGEELFFRGVLQNEVKNIFGNPHFAIWFTAFAFSFVHFQFFGFVPRVVLGLLFGYLYWWSGNILIPMFLHFLNNAATLILMNFYKDKFDLMEKQTAEKMPVVGLLFSLIITGALIYYCHKLYKERISANGAE